MPPQLSPPIIVKVRRLFQLIATTGALTLTGCLGGSTEPVVVSGVYQIQSINGGSIPYTFSNGVKIVSEVFTINKDGSFTDVTTQGDGTVITDQGVYANFGGTINFSDQTAGLVYQGYVQGTQLTTVIGNFTSVYTKSGESSR